MLKLNSKKAGLATTLLCVGLISGCSDSGDTNITNTVINRFNTVPTRADEIATRIDESWSDNERSINLSSTEEFDESRVFQSVDGGGIIAYNTGDDGNEHSYLAYYGPSGGVIQNVEIESDTFDSAPFDPQSINDMVVVFTPSGDAVIAFIADQDSDAAVPNDVATDRVYYGTFTRSLASTASASTGQRFGFSKFTAIDTNVLVTDDNNPVGMFVSTNLIDGQTNFTGSSNEIERSGSLGDSASNATPFIFIGWTYNDANNDIRAEGKFVDLSDADNDGDRLELTSPTATQISLPTVIAGENVNQTVRTSGRDMLFSTLDTGVTPNQNRLFLARVNSATNPPTITAPVEISRGTTTTATNSFNILSLIGDGYRALNGQSTTWLIYRENNFDDATVTQADADLMIAQISSTGTVTLDEFDHNPAAAANANSVNTNTQVQICRGASRAFIYYTQTFDVTAGAVQTDTSLFVRALRLNGDNTLANNVSNEGEINGTHDTDNNNDTDVVNFQMSRRDPFSSPDTNNNSSYVAFEQEIDGDTDGRTLRARLVTISDITATSLAITLGTEETIIANSDTGFGIRDLTVLQGSSSSGQGLVFYGANGNNISNNTATGAFTERRPFIYAASLPNSQSITTPLQVGSDSAPGLVTFGQFKQLEGDANLGAVVTPIVPASRDFNFDTDTSTPQFAHLIANEFERTNGSEEGTTYVGRVLDLRNNAQIGVVGNRFSPRLSMSPFQVGTTDGHEFEDINQTVLELIPQGNDVVAIFNTESQTDEGNDGKFFINTFSGGSWSDAALFTNDAPDPLNDEDSPFAKSGATYEIIRGVSSGIDSGVGTWLFWVRADFSDESDSGDERFLLQGRRITGTSMSRK